MDTIKFILCAIVFICGLFIYKKTQNEFRKELIKFFGISVVLAIADWRLLSIPLISVIIAYLMVKTKIYRYLYEHFKN